LHAWLGQHLGAWYAAVDALEPGRVICELPFGGLPTEVPKARVRRSEVTLLDALMESLPSP